MNEITYIGKHPLALKVPLHMHEDWEFIYCTNGQGYLQFGDLQIHYEEGDTVIIPPRTSHSNHSDAGFANIYINMSNASLPYKEPKVIKDDASKHIYETFNSMHYHYYSNLERKSLVVSSLAMVLLSLFIVHEEASDIGAIVQQIEANILENFSDCYYDLNDYLKKFYFNNDYIRKLFKRELGVTPNQYLIDKRLQTSADLLCSMNHDNNNISSVATACGFKDPLYFSRMFKKKYHMSPSDYTKNSKEDKKEQTPEDFRILIDTK